jgi:CHAT domain-containing protein
VKACSDWCARFLYAGASSVNVSLWSVNDAATAALMKQFYRNLSQSVPPAEALRRAKIALLHQGQSALAPSALLGAGCSLASIAPRNAMIPHGFWPGSDTEPDKEDRDK